ncbi:protein CURLY FLAG LEAF 1-like [Rutidosis leptorrhynchoides]|uniref:protein CURLY FLAG LEAF 1-like n=1 Tax=Rutidosis leptorrhynchoides TaxID=125765 RepID=UPI003A99E32E
MTAPNIAAITASLERSLQSFSLNHRSTTTTTTTTSAAAEESPTNHYHRSTNSSDSTLELNSNITLPYHWEQCLDLKTGEMYYINWRTGMKTKEDPRTVDDGFSGYFYSDDDDDEEAEEESSYDGNEESSVESSPAVSSSRKQKQIEKEDENEDENESCIISGNENRSNGVLVVAGCKGCFMYFMVPKQVEDCPKCCGQLLHFDRSSSDDN